MGENLVSIYALIDPRDNSVRYVGKTTMTLAGRLSAHVSDCHKRNNHRSNWIKLLLRLGVRPVIELIEEVPADVWEDRERYWIAHFIESGSALTNSTTGGEKGAEASQEVRAKMAAAKRGKPGNHRGMKHTPEAIAKMKAALKGRKSSYGMLGKKASPETISKRAAKLKANHPMRGKHFSAEIRAKMSAAAKARWACVPKKPKPVTNPHWRKGLKQSPETIAKRAAAMQGHVQGPETRAKISAAHKGRKHTEQARANMSAAHMGHTQNAETRAKKSAAGKAAWARRKASASQLPIDL